MDEEAKSAVAAEPPAGEGRRVVGECADCGKAIYVDDDYIVDHNGRTVCEECREHYEQCRDCGEWFYEDDVFAHYRDEALCRSCYDNGDYCTCDDCDEVFLREDGYITHDGRYICDSCYDGNYFTCERCDEVYHDDEGRWVNDDHYCDSCADEEESRPKGVRDYHDFPRSRYRPRVVEGEDQSTTLCFGVELEVEGGAFDIDAFEKWTGDDDLVHFEHDGSLDDDGVECITMPCSLRFHQQKMRWDELCRAFRLERFLSHDASNCGLHVHLTRRLIPVSSLVKIDVWLNRWPLWRDIARRDRIYGGAYLGVDKPMDIGHVVCGMGPTAPKSPVHKKWRDNPKNCDRYQALNICTSGSREVAEVRIFKGTLNPETILGTIEAVAALVKFAEATPTKYIYEDKTAVRFLKYVAERKSDYPHVYPMLGRLAKECREPQGVMEVVRQNA